MGTHGRSSERKREKTSSSKRRSRRRSYDSESDSDETDSRDSSPVASSRKRRESGGGSRSSHRSRRRNSSRGRDSGDDSSYESDGSDDGGRKKIKSSRKVTEEEISEYLAKKAQKKALRVAKKLKSQTVSGYSNDSNPFGDSNLNEKFVWRKKIERDVTQGVPLDAFSVKAEKKRQRERMAEIEKVKKRREERALEKAQHEEEMALLARERARAEFQDWEKKEEEFHFDQSKVRSEIRVRDGRSKPIDILSKQLNGSDDFDIVIDEPYTVFKGLTVKEMEELRDDIKMHLDMDRATPTHIEYWEALLVVCDWELAEARKKDALDRARVRGEEPPAELLAEERGLHSSIETDVKNLLEGKTYGELEALQSQIESQMRSGTAKVVEYWEAVVKRLHIYKAKACLKEIHTKKLHEHLLHLEQPLEDENEDKMEQEVEMDADHSLQVKDDDDNEQIIETQAYSPNLLEEEENQEAGSFSPELMHGDEDEEAVDPEEDRAILERKRMAVLEEQQRRIQEAMATKPPVPPEDNFELKASKAMGVMEEGDAVFGSGAEVNLDSQVYWWHDKYRPRKPKYFNRVHTGYEWNKYNQTHYDHDNPPPKIVQGYKFNIFYPDLVDKTKAPTYTIEKDGNSSETCIIRFHAGPPYEDIAFRIVNKEWEYSHKKGFKCTFERGILHVYFNFKRYRYRR
ncbi:cactin [Momordica charantia]|uniref:Splicing factor Cactin n=1 Tax=Momordica charantia TaxID=3673 RepID=A0A6J1CS05_MOMCH|nr:cactin [Momordica charantia]